MPSGFYACRSSDRPDPRFAASVFAFVPAKSNLEIDRSFYRFVSPGMHPPAAPVAGHEM